MIKLTKVTSAKPVQIKEAMKQELSKTAIPGDSEIIVALMPTMNERNMAGRFI